MSTRDGAVGRRASGFGRIDSALLHVGPCAGYRGLVVAAAAYVVIMLNTVGTQVGAYTLLPQLFDARSRYTGTATGWNAGVVIAGGTAPFTAVWLIEQTGHGHAPAWFVIATALVGLLAAAWIRRTVTRDGAPGA